MSGCRSVAHFAPSFTFVPSQRHAACLCLLKVLGDCSEDRSAHRYSSGAESTALGPQSGTDGIFLLTAVEAVTSVQHQLWFLQTKSLHAKH